eukprot:TRINITY_DN9458_c0_g1_i1.p1 TRINITY_DN9458_c0_g1~~TRINITY_DN9458_c0_g1_i1.p1  ORF type:complete len:269 (+),score=81.78 TRINITY_DN9458_c0_g1_i1:534-1340(+)
MEHISTHKINIENNLLGSYVSKEIISELTNYHDINEDIKSYSSLFTTEDLTRKIIQWGEVENDLALKYQVQNFCNFVKREVLEFKHGELIIFNYHKGKNKKKYGRFKEYLNYDKVRIYTTPLEESHIEINTKNIFKLPPEINKMLSTCETYDYSFLVKSHFHSISKCYFRSVELYVQYFIRSYLMKNEITGEFCLFIEKAISEKKNLVEGIELEMEEKVVLFKQLCSTKIVVEEIKVEREEDQLFLFLAEKQVFEKSFADEKRKVFCT